MYKRLNDYYNPYVRGLTLAEISYTLPEIDFEIMKSEITFTVKFMLNKNT